MNNTTINTMCATQSDATLHGAEPKPETWAQNGCGPKRACHIQVDAFNPMVVRKKLGCFIIFFLVNVCFVSVGMQRGRMHDLWSFARGLFVAQMATTWSLPCEHHQNAPLAPSFWRHHLFGGPWHHLFGVGRGAQIVGARAFPCYSVHSTTRVYRMDLLASEYRKAHLRRACMGRSMVTGRN